MKALLIFFILMIFLLAPVYAITVTYSQPDADSGEVIKGKEFTVTASGWSGSCTTATISLAECSGCALTGESEQKSISGQSSVSWTTVVANQKVSGKQKISVSVSGGCTLQSGSVEFYVSLPPELDVSITPASVSVNAGSTFNVNVNIHNKGETSGAAPSGGDGGAGAGGAAAAVGFVQAPQNRSKKFIFAPHGLLNNTKLLAAIEKVLAKGKLSEAARQNLIDIVNVIKGDIETNRDFEYSAGKSRIRTRMKYKGKKKIRNFMIFETLPKSFSNKASDVNVRTNIDARIEVVEEDPSWLITYSEVNPEDELVIEYEVSGQKTSDVLDSVTTEIYAESLEEIEKEKEIEEVRICEEGSKRCFGNELQECKDNKWKTIEICEYGCENDMCKKPPAVEEGKKKEIIPGFFVIIIVLVCIFIILGIIIRYYKYKR